MLVANDAIDQNEVAKASPPRTDLRLSWYISDVLDTLFLALSSLLAFTMLHQYYIYKVQAT